MCVWMDDEISECIDGLARCFARPWRPEGRDQQPQIHHKLPQLQHARCLQHFHLSLGDHSWRRSLAGISSCSTLLDVICVSVATYSVVTDCVWFASWFPFPCGFFFGTCCVICGSHYLYMTHVVESNWFMSDSVYILYLVSELGINKVNLMFIFIHIIT